MEASDGQPIGAPWRVRDSPAEEIFRDYPSLPVDGIDAVVRWAEATYGPDWKSAHALAPGH